MVKNPPLRRVIPELLSEFESTSISRTGEVCCGFSLMFMNRGSNSGLLQLTKISASFPTGSFVGFTRIDLVGALGWVEPLDGLEGGWFELEGGLGVTSSPKTEM